MPSGVKLQAAQIKLLCLIYPNFLVSDITLTKIIVTEKINKTRNYIAHNLILYLYLEKLQYKSYLSIDKEVVTLVINTQIKPCFL